MDEFEQLMSKILVTVDLTFGLLMIIVLTVYDLHSPYNPELLSIPQIVIFDSNNTECFSDLPSACKEGPFSSLKYDFSLDDNRLTFKQAFHYLCIVSSWSFLIHRLWHSIKSAYKMHILLTPPQVLEVMTYKTRSFFLEWLIVCMGTLPAEALTLIITAVYGEPVRLVIICVPFLINVFAFLRHFCLREVFHGFLLDLISSLIFFHDLDFPPRGIRARRTAGR